MRSEYRQQSPVEEDNPFSEGSDGDSLEDDDDSPHSQRPRRLVPYKANQALDVDSDNPWRSSTVIGNHPGTGKERERDVNAVPAKAQKTLGLSKAGQMITEQDYRRAHSLSPQTDNVAPKALRTLGIPSNPFQRSALADDRSIIGEETERHSLHRGHSVPNPRAKESDDFKRLLTGSRARGPESSSGTDASSISRSSMLSSQADHRFDTPRSSHEISPEELHQKSHAPWFPWARPGSAFSRRQRPATNSTMTTSTTDSFVDPAAVLTEPFKDEPFSPYDPSPPWSPGTNPPEYAFELPASFPKGQHAKGDIAELPATEAPIAELPSNESPSPRLEPQFGGPEQVPRPPPPRRSGSNRTPMQDAPKIPELPGISSTSSSLGSLETPATAKPHSQSQYHHQLQSQQSTNTSHLPPSTTGRSPPAPPSRKNSTSQRLTRAIAQTLPPTSAAPSTSRNTQSLPPLATNLPSTGPLPKAATVSCAGAITSYNPPPPPLPPSRESSLETTSLTTSRKESADSLTAAPHPSTPELPGDRQSKPAVTDSHNPRPIPSHSSRPSTPTQQPAEASAVPTTPISPSASHAGLGAIAKAAALGPGGGAARKGSVSSQHATKRDHLAELGALQREVDALRGEGRVGDEREREREGDGEGDGQREREGEKQRERERRG